MITHKTSEFAVSLSELKSDLRGRYMTTCIEHLVKLAVLNSPRNINHWRSEVYAAVHSINKLKKDNKYPKASVIFDTVWNAYGDDLDKFIDTAIKEEPNEKMKSNIKDADDIIKPVYNYVMWLSLELSKHGKINRQDCFNKLEEIEL